MFLQQAYERRLYNSENSHQQQAKNQIQNFKIGSIKNGKYHFDKDEEYFSINDIPQKHIEKKKLIKQFIDPDILNLRKKEWNPSSLLPLNPHLEETHEHKLMKIKLGLIDRPIQLPKEKQQSENKEFLKWNISTEQNIKERQKALKEQTSQSKLLNKNKYENLLSNYNSPYQSVKNLEERNRYLKKAEKEHRNILKEEYIFKNPNSSIEKIEGAVFRLDYESKLRKKQIQLINPNCIFKPVLYKPNCEKTTKFFHNGIYQSFPHLKTTEDTKQKHNSAWSCCLNSEKQSQGCNKYTIDNKRWMYASYVQ